MKTVKNMKRNLEKVEKFKSIETAELVYSELIRQDQEIISNINDLNTKIIGIIAFNGTLISLTGLIIVQILDLDVIHYSKLGPVISWIFVVVSTILAMHAYKEYEIGKLDAKFYKPYLDKSRQVLLEMLCVFFSKSFKLNCNIHIEKNKWFNWSLRLSLCGVIILFATFSYWIILWCL